MPLIVLALLAALGCFSTLVSAPATTRQPLKAGSVEMSKRAATAAVMTAGVIAGALLATPADAITDLCIARNGLVRVQMGTGDVRGDRQGVEGQSQGRRELGYGDRRRSQQGTGAR